MNLATKLVLTGVPVILDNATGESPTTIDIPTGVTQSVFIASPTDPTQVIQTDVTNMYADDSRYTLYTIDPSGNLFGNTECELENWKKYLVSV